MEHDGYRLTPKQRRALDRELARRKGNPPDGWYWLVVVIFAMIGIFAMLYVVVGATGCGVSDAALVKDVQTHLDATLQPVIAGIAKVENYTSGIKTKMDNIREANISGRDQINSNFDKWALYLLILLPAVSYIVPKIIWIMGQKTLGKVKRRKKVTVSE